MRGVVASLTVVAVGALWGVYWVPLRALDAVAAAGPWATFAVSVVGCLVLAPSIWPAWGRIRASNAIALWSTALGGASFALYSNGLLYGQVTVVILLFYLTPIWSTLIARCWLHQPVSQRRYVAIALGLAGIAIVLHGSHAGLPLPHRIGDWFGLASGILWAVVSTGIHRHSRTGPLEANFLFCIGAAAMALVIALMLGAGTPPRITPEGYAAAAGWTLLIGVLWWAIALSVFLWATQMLEPARVGVLLMSEVVVGSGSAALFANEPFSPLMAIGMALVIASGFLETLPDRRPA